MKFKKVENPMETVTVNGVKIVPDEVFEVKNQKKIVLVSRWKHNHLHDMNYTKKDK